MGKYDVEVGRQHLYSMQRSEEKRLVGRSVKSSGGDSKTIDCRMNRLLGWSSAAKAS